MAAFADPIPGPQGCQLPVRAPGALRDSDDLPPFSPEGGSPLHPDQESRSFAWEVDGQLPLARSYLLSARVAYENPGIQVAFTH